MTISVRVDPTAGIDLETARAGRAGPIIVLLHGLGGNCRSWDPQLIELSADHRVVSWTMPGYGPSAAPEPYDFAALGATVAALIDDLGEPATVIGHSMGGYVAQELALSHPRRITSLVLAGTTAAFGKPGSEFNHRFLAARLAPLDRGATPGDLAPSVVDGLLGPGADDDVRRAAIDSMSAIPIDGYRRALETLVTWDARQRLSAIGLPTLCIAGELDNTAPPRSVKELADAIPGASYETMARVGHLMNLEDPALFCRIVRRFVDSVG